MEAVAQPRLWEMEQNDAVPVVAVAVDVTMMDQGRNMLVRQDECVIESWPRKDQWPPDHCHSIPRHRFQIHYQCSCCCFVLPSFAGH